MTIVVNPSIPPSLANAFATVAKLRRGTGDTPATMGASPSLYTRAPGKATDALSASYMATATLLTQWHASALSSAAQSQFYAARLAEIRARTFPAAYWYATAPTYRWADYGTPEYVVASTQPVSPEYYDPTRRISRCFIKNSSASYALPAGHGTVAQPGPGWKGQVIDTLYRDLYSVRARFWFKLPVRATPAAIRPALMLLTAKLEATATRGGNIYWFIVNTSSSYSKNSGTGYWSYMKFRTFFAWDKNRISKLPPSGVTPWTFTEEFTSCIDAKAHAIFTYDTYWDWLEVAVWTSPAQGRYFSLNDAIEFHGTYAAILHTPRKPNE